MKNSIIKYLLSGILIIVLSFMMPLQSLAASYNVSYVSDVRIGYGADGKKALEDAGYTVWTELNANEGGKGSAVWIGYKTTNNKEEAITDFAVMNMSGGYSFDAYTEEVEKLNQKVSNQLGDFRASIDEFGKNYADGNRFAVYAKELLNTLTDEDVTAADGSPAAIGDLFLDPSTSDETLHKIFLEGNTEAIEIIERALAIGCTEIGDDNLLTRLGNAEYTDELPSSLSHARSVLASAFSSFHSDALAAKHAYETVETKYGSLEEYTSSSDINNAETLITVQNYTRYMILSGSEYGDTGMSLLDFGLLDLENENDEGWVVNDELLNLLAGSMTPGQIGIVSNVGLLTVLSYAALSSDAEESFDDLRALLPTVQSEEKVSVFYGVDRTLFSDIDTVALTSAALRDKAANEGSNFGKDSSANKTTAAVLTGIGTVVLSAGIIATSYFGYILHLTAKDTIGSIGEQVAAEAIAAAGRVGFSGSVAGTIGLALGIVAIIAGIVLTIFAILKWIEKPETPHIEYTAVPRVLVDLREDDSGSKVYVNYYAALRIDAIEGSEDSTDIYGDLNAYNGQDEWDVLYYTKNATAGVPITDEILVSSTSVLKSSKSEYFRPLHRFGSTVPANLNQYNTQSGSDSIYVFFRTVESNLMSASVFGLSPVWYAIIAFIAGGLICSAMTYAFSKKKNKAKEKEAI